MKFCYNFEVYFGGVYDDKDDECGVLGQDVVLQFVRGLDGKDYVVINDNYFILLVFYEDLLVKGLYVIGIVYLWCVGFLFLLNFGDDFFFCILYVYMYRD